MNTSTRSMLRVLVLLRPRRESGFGLPLIEAVRHRIPMIVRDIPVFWEVAGEHASYFAGNRPEDLRRAIANWLALYSTARHPKPDDMPWMTWAESAAQMKPLLLED